MMKASIATLKSRNPSAKKTTGSQRQQRRSATHNQALIGQIREARNSPRLQLPRKSLATSRNKKQLQGLHEAILERASLVKTTDSTVTIKEPGQQDTVLNKSDVDKIGTAEQRQIPIIIFAVRKTVRDHNSMFLHIWSRTPRKKGTKFSANEPSVREIHKRQKLTERQKPTSRKSTASKSRPKNVINLPPRKVLSKRKSIVQHPLKSRPTNKRTNIAIRMQVKTSQSSKNNKRIR